MTKLFLKLQHFLLSQFEKLFSGIEALPTTFPLWIGTFLSIVITRIFIEIWLAKFYVPSAYFLYIEFLHTFLFFLFSFIVFALLFSWYLRKSIRQSANVLLFGFIIIIFPPVLDFIISNGKGFWSFYKIDSLIGLIERYCTFFGDAPHIGITYGVRIEVAIATVFSALYAFVSTRSYMKTAFFAVMVYTTFFFFGTFPSWITILTEGFSKGFLSVTATDVAQQFLTPIRLFFFESKSISSSLGLRISMLLLIITPAIILFASYLKNKPLTTALVKNARFPQLIYHGGLVLFGMGTAVYFAEKVPTISFFEIVATAVAIEAVFFAWLASVVANDLFDKRIDAVSNTDRPLIQNVITNKEYAIIGWVLFIFSLVAMSLVSMKSVLFLAAYQALAWIYNAPPFRFKRFPFVASFIAASASVTVVLAGYFILAELGDMSLFPKRLLILLIVGYTLSLPIKDFKDEEGDRADRIYTLPILLGSYNARIAVGCGMFFSYLLSVWAFNESSLWIWAFLFGGIALWILLTNCKVGTFSVSNRNLLWAEIVCVSFYVAILLWKVVI